ncbi:hypothetical protein [Schlegelella aquatica]|uniref:hypothetical protein n=1 Tax=Caldimonas aquatica TaxID=376175 RepID=UPI0037526EF4
MIYTTLNRIREHSPCADGWRKLLKYLGKTGPDDAPLAYIVILDAVGLDDALWCLRAEPQHASIWRMYAVRCARRVQHLMTDERSLQALDVAERHARGLAADKELDAARLDAGAAVWTAAGAAVWTAVGADARAAWAAARAAWAAVGAAAGNAGNAAGNAAGDAARAAARTTARAEQTADFEALLAAHHAMPGESCALVDWWEEIAA